MQFLVLGLVISGYVFFGMPFVELWAGNGYRDSYYIGLLLMVPVTLPLLQNLGIEIQKAKNLHQFRSWVYLGVAVGNVALSIPLAQRFEGIGAAAATATSLIIGNVIIMNWHYQARVGLDIKEFWRQSPPSLVRTVPRDRCWDDGRLIRGSLTRWRAHRFHRRLRCRVRDRHVEAWA